MVLNRCVWLGGLLLFTGCGLTSWAQLLPDTAPIPFAEITATEDGQWVYFTSVSVLKGKKENWEPETRLYRYGPDGIKLFAERGRLAPRNGGGSGRVPARRR